MKLKRFFAAWLIPTLVTLPLFALAGNKSLESDSTIRTAPQYQIIDIGVVQTGDTASQGFGASTGGAAVGRSFRTGGTQAFSWTPSGGIVGLPNLTARNFCVSNSANNAGSVVGTCSTTAFGSGRLPTVWQNGAVSQLPLPVGETLGDANDVNSAGIAVGSINAGSLQRGVIYNGGTATVITQTTTGGSFFTTAFGINDSGRVVGPGIDPNNAARNVGMVYDIGSGSAFEVGALPGNNGAIAFGVGNGGHVVGSSMQNQGSGLPFIWTQAGGMVAIPLPTGTSQGSARAVNSTGWAVGTASSAFAIPFLYDGTTTYRLQDLIPANSGWDLSMNTSSSALGISDGRVIVGTGVFNGQTRAYAMVPVTNGTTRTAFDFDGDGKSDRSVFRASDQTWYISRSTAGFSAVQFGAATDKLVPADYDGDGKTDVAVWRENAGTPGFSYFYILQSLDNTFRPVQFGTTNDNPAVVGDWDGDGRADLAVYRDGASNGGQSFFYYRPSSQPGVDFIPVQWGTTNDKPVAGDYDGDGKTDAAIFRPSNGGWFVRQSSNAQPRFDLWGSTTDKIVPADYDGDGRTDLAVFRNGTWYIKQSSTNQPRYEVFGNSTDKLVPADYDGDSRADVAVFRNGTWYLQQSTSGFAASNFGNATDRPAAETF